MKSSNIDTSFFVYLLNAKHNIKLSKEDNFDDILKGLDVCETLKTEICNYLVQSEKLDTLQKRDFLTNLDDKIEDNFSESNLTTDVLFCFLNAQTVLLKIFKDKSVHIERLKAAYDNSFKSNKCFLRDYNAKKETKPKKVNINDTPAITRFAPEPAGFLHIGHVKAICVSYNLAKKTNGKFLLRFDDTNPTKDYKSFKNKILIDLDTLGITGYTISHSSDYFDTLIEYAKNLITKNKAYVDNTDREVMSHERYNGIESKCRNNTIDYNLDVFNKMLEGKVAGYCLRAKISFSALNKALRDPVIYRCSDVAHYRCNKYLAYPTYDFVCPILDSIEGVTVAYRADEYRDRKEQYNWFIKTLELQNKPELRDFSKLSFENSILSKRKIDKLVKDKLVEDWTDPRLATIQGIKRLGMHMEALKEYVNLQGASNKTSVISWDKIWAINKKLIDSTSPRFMAIEELNAVKVNLTNFGKEGYYKEILLHKKNEELGYKKLFFYKTILVSQEDAKILKENEEFTLMNFGNAFVRKKIYKDDLVSEMDVELHLEGDYKSTEHKISWCSQVNSIIIKTIEYNDLFVGETYNCNSKVERLYYVESSILENMKLGMHVQFERIGFFYCDNFFVYNLVPFTKQKRTY